MRPYLPTILTFVLLSTLSFSSQAVITLSLTEQVADWLHNVQHQTFLFYDQTNKIAFNIFNLGLNAYFRLADNAQSTSGDNFLRNNVPSFVENTNTSMEELQEPDSFLDLLRTTTELYKEIDTTKYENLVKLQNETTAAYENILKELQLLKDLASLEIADKTSVKTEVVEMSSYTNLNELNKTMLIKLKNRLSIAVRKQSVAFNTLTVYLNDHKSNTDFTQLQDDFTSFKEQNVDNFNFEYVFTGNEPEEEEPKSPFSEDGGLNEDTDDNEDPDNKNPETEEPDNNQSENDVTEGKEIEAEEFPEYELKPSNKPGTETSGETEGQDTEPALEEQEISGEIEIEGETVIESDSEGTVNQETEDLSDGENDPESIIEKEYAAESESESIRESESESNSDSNPSSVFDVNPSLFVRTEIPMTYTGIFGYSFSGGRVMFKQQIFSFFFIPRFHFFLKVLFILLVGRNRRLEQVKFEANCVNLGENKESNAEGNYVDYNCGVDTGLEEGQIAGILDENGIAVDQMTATELKVYTILIKGAEDLGPVKNTDNIITEANHRATSDESTRRIAFSGEADKCPGDETYSLNFTKPEEAINVPCTLSDSCTKLYCNMDLNPSTEYEISISNALASNGQSVFFRTPNDDSDTIKLKTSDKTLSSGTVRAKSSGLSGGAIAGIIIAIAVALTLIVVLSLCCLFKKKTPYVPAHNTSVQSMQNIGQKID